MWAVLHEVRSECAQMLTAVFLMINVMGDGRWMLCCANEREPRSSRSGIAAKGIGKRIGDGIADDVLVFRAQEPA
jgi:hypothetical protein